MAELVENPAAWPGACYYGSEKLILTHIGYEKRIYIIMMANGLQTINHNDVRFVMEGTQAHNTAILKT